MASHNEVRTGLWYASRNDERWSLDEGFDSRDEAIAHGIREFDGNRFWTGCAYVLTDGDVAEAFIRDADEADEHIGCQDEWCWCDEPLISRNVSAEADAELIVFVTAWVSKHELRNPKTRVDEIEEFKGGA